jgi:hypothetical protein
MSEGGYQARDSSFYIGPGLNLTLKTVETAPTITPIASIKLINGRTSAIAIPNEINILVQTTDIVSYYLILNPTLTSSNFSSYSTISNVQTDTSATALTGGRIIKQGFLSSSSQVKDKINLNEPDLFNYQLGISINGTSDIITLAASSYASTANVFATLGWTELN